MSPPLPQLRPSPSLVSLPSPRFAFQGHELIYFAPPWTIRVTEGGGRQEIVVVVPKMEALGQFPISSKIWLKKIRTQRPILFSPTEERKEKRTLTRLPDHEGATNHFLDGLLFSLGKGEERRERSLRIFFLRLPRLAHWRGGFENDP